MTIAPLTNTTRRELARRVNGGLEITLYWNPHDNSTTIDVHQTTTDETISFPVNPERALDAFHHPFAHLAVEETALMDEERASVTGVFRTDDLQLQEERHDERT